MLKNGLFIKNNNRLNKNYILHSTDIIEAISYVEEITSNLDKFRSKHRDTNYKLDLLSEADGFKIKLNITNEKEYQT
jgi:hypothetical protein